MFLRLSEAKIKEGIFIGPQIRDIIKDEYFDMLFEGEEKLAWDSFTFVVKVFLGNRRTQNYEELVNNLLQSYQKLGCNMSLQYTFLNRIWNCSRIIVLEWVMNTENVSVKTFLQWRRNIKGSGTVLCSPTAAALGCVLFVWVYLHVSLCMQQHLKCERAILLVCPPFFCKLRSSSFFSQWLYTTYQNIDISS